MEKGMEDGFRLLIAPYKRKARQPEFESKSVVRAPPPCECAREKSCWMPGFLEHSPTSPIEKTVDGGVE